MHNQKSSGASGSGSGSADSTDASGSIGDEPELVHRIERPLERSRNPFADDEGEEDGIDSDDDEDDPAAPPPGSSLRTWSHRGGWWRDVLRKSKGPEGRNVSGDDNDSIGDEEDETGSGGVDDEDDEEFGEFAMPQVTSVIKQQQQHQQAEATSRTGVGANKDSDQGSDSSDREPEKVILKPLPVHPPASKTGFSSLWPFGGEKKEGEPGAGEKGGGSGEEERQIKPANEGIKKTVEAKGRMNIEDPDEDEVVVEPPRGV